jgi:hypothetical protein
MASNRGVVYVGPGKAARNALPCRDITSHARTHAERGLSLSGCRTDRRHSISDMRSREPALIVFLCTCAIAIGYGDLHERALLLVSAC